VPTKRRTRRPIAAVERILYTREEAAMSLGMSVDMFKRRVQPFIGSCRVERSFRYRPRSMRRWAREHARALVQRAPVDAA
jgi:hypothetical protein